MVLGWIALYLTEERPFPVWVVSTGCVLLLHRFLHIELLLIEITLKNLINCWPVSTMDNLDMSLQPLGTAIILVTLAALMPLALYTTLLMLSQHLVGGQHFGTVVTGELLPL